MAGKPDPWEWNTDEVVRELCAENPAWAPPNVRVKLPPLDVLELRIRENELDGCSFLGVGSEHPDFFPDLGIKVGKHKETIRYAIAHWRKMSPMYRLDQIRRQREDDSDTADNSFAANPPRTIDAPHIESSRRKLDEERKGDSDHSTYVTPEPMPLGSNGHTPAATPKLAPSTLPDATALVPAKNKDAKELEEPARKRRKIAPTTLLADQSAAVVRNIPNGTLITGTAIPVDMPGSYLGVRPFNRTDILEFTSDSEPLDEEERTFVFSAKPEPYGRRRQRSCLLKRYLAGGWERRLQAAGGDMIFGGNDPEHYHILPAYGDSDDEYDDATWNEIEKEERERKANEERKKKTAPKELTEDQKHDLINKIVEERELFWTENKLPGIQRKAYGIWNAARKQGLRYAISWQDQELQRLQRRLEGLKEKIMKNQWSSEAEIRKGSDILEPTVDSIQHTHWNLMVIKLPSEPQKRPRAPRQPKFRQNHSMEAEDEEVLTSSSEGEGAGLDDLGDVDKDIIAQNGDEMGIDGFVVHDEEIAAQDGDEMVIEDDGLPRFHGLGETATQPGHSVETTSDESRTQVDDLGEPAIEPPTPCVSQYDNDTEEESGHAQGRSKPRSEVTTPKRTPSSSRTKLEAETIDLTQSVRSPSIDPGANEATPRGQNLIDLTTPPRPTTPTSRTILQLSPIQREKLSETERAVLGEIELLDPYFRSTVLEFALLNDEQLFKDLVVPALEAKKLPMPDIANLSKKPFKTSKIQDDFNGLVLAHLFDTFLGNEKKAWKDWFNALANGGKQKIKDQEPQFASFVYFLRKIGLAYKRGSIQNSVGPVPKPATSLSSSKRTAVHGNGTKLKIECDEDASKLDPDATESEDDQKGKGKAKKVIMRDKAAQDLRESDQIRLREQEERRQAMRQKLALMEGSGDSQKTRYIVNDSKRHDQPFIYVPNNIVPYIKDHQVAGVRFMWNQITNDVHEAQGCLLAHTMGLGKTMQIITLLTTISESCLSEDPAVSAQIPAHLRVSRTLILCPPGISNNWYDELFMWTDGNTAHGLGFFYKVDFQTSSRERVKLIQAWAGGTGVLIVGYQMFSRMIDDPTLAPLLLESPSIVVADEAHHLKNSRSQVHQKSKLFRTHTRIALTGSPLANNVLEYHAMINWVAPNYLSDEKEFREVYATPIEQGLSIKSTSNERRRALVKLRSLRTTVAPKVHRRTIHALKDQIPPKTEFVIAVELTEFQRRAYERFVCARSGDMATVKLFSLMNALSLLCNHPACFRTHLTLEKNGQQVEDSLTKNGAMSQEGISNVLQLIPSDIVNGIDGEKLAWKAVILLRLLDECQKQSESVLVFSQSILTLDYLEQALRRHRMPYVRLDGKTRIHNRQDMVKTFNKSDFGVFLISTTAGGVGLNITGASRVVIFDFKFNPQHEQQAIGRAYRLGQKKPVFVYRFVCAESFEEKMLARSVFKLQLASRIVDQKNPIPKGVAFGEQLFVKPNDPQKHDLTTAMGKDQILDSVLESEEAKGICSIMLAEMFEEEDLADEELTPEEHEEARQLTNVHNARRLPMNDSRHVQGAMAQGNTAAATPGPSALRRPVVQASSMAPKPLATPKPPKIPASLANPKPPGTPKPPATLKPPITPVSSANPKPSENSGPSTTVPGPSQKAAPALSALAPTHSPAEEAHTRSPAQPDAVAPVMGATTQFRPPPSGRNESVVVAAAQDQPEDQAEASANVGSPVKHQA
jgi:SNF2 family DNA or RNA helicase